MTDSDILQKAREGWEYFAARIMQTMHIMHAIHNTYNMLNTHITLTQVLNLKNLMAPCKKTGCMALTNNGENFMHTMHNMHIMQNMHITLTLTRALNFKNRMAP